MKHWRSFDRTRLYSALGLAWRFLYAHPWLLLMLPLAVFFPLLDSRGLFELGDANFPLNPFRIDYILPWSAAGFGGADNTFVGVPRLVYHLGINLLIVTTHNLQVSQWIWYSAMTALGIGGAFKLGRRLGAGIYAVPLAVFYALNIWSYDRIAQGPIYLSYQAMPLVVYCLLRYLGRPSVARALTFGVTVLFVIPSLQVCYLAVVMCLAIAIRHLILYGWRSIVALAGLGAAVVAVNAFYVFSMIADMLVNSGGNIALVNSRFNIGVFEHYAQRVTIPNTLAMASFFYSSIDEQWRFVALAASLLPIMLGALLLLARRPALRSRFYAGLLLALLGVWLVDGIVIAPGFYQWFRDAIPGLRSFVEPDYFSPLYLFGAFVMLAAWARLGARAYAGLWDVAVWVLVAGGIVPFLPINGPKSGMPQTGQPRQYAEFSRAKVPGNTLWLPPYRGVQYRWSPYEMNGFTSLNSPSDAIGPTMAEAVGQGAGLVQERLADGFIHGQTHVVRSLAPLMSIGTVAIAADSLNATHDWPNWDVLGALQTLDLLERDGFLKARSDERDVGVHLVTATTTHFLPEVGVYDAPVSGGNFTDLAWWSVLDHRPGDYRPMLVETADSQAEPAGTTRWSTLHVQRRSFTPGEFTGITDCAGETKPVPVDPKSRELTVSADQYGKCLVMALPDFRTVRALQATFDLDPPGVALPIVMLLGKGFSVSMDSSLVPVEIPQWPLRVFLAVKLFPNTTVTIKGMTLSWMAQSVPSAATAPPHTCSTSDLRWSKNNPMSYALEGTVSGRCTVVFRQAFAPIWTLSGTGAKVLDHVQVDGFANGWTIDASGPVSLRIVNRAVYAYGVGLAVTIASVLLALGLGVASSLRRIAMRRASRAPSPA